ncbi:MAG TPA: multiheme c-type cytochrome [Thermoanaerobaculia bacterium]
MRPARGGVWLLLALAPVLGVAPAPPPPSAPVAASAPAAARGLYVGPISCAGSLCHGSELPRRDYDVLQNEYFTWFHRDRHRRAFEALLDERSETIARHLRLGTPAAEARVCLDCHVLAPPPEVRTNLLELEDGISCEACHGPASGWLEGHRSASWSYEDAVRAGMTDLRRLEVRAGLCLSCHQGAPGRGVDHDLIAAGHPELVFELDNYTAQMPPHWLPFGERRDPPPGLRPSHGARAWAVGQVVSFGEGLAQLARRARSERWPEFSELRCAGCHHSLAGERWRRASYPDRPGLPRWSPARWAVLRHLVDAFAPGARPELDAEIARLAQQTARLATPPAEVADTAERAGRGLAPVAARVEAASWEPAQVRRLLLAMTGDSAFLADADFQSAEQAYFAVHTLVAELIAADPRAAAGGLTGPLERMYQELGDPETFDRGRFLAQLGELERQARRLP